MGYLTDLESEEEIAKEIQDKINQLFLEATDIIKILKE
ncbi:hypothetical protein C2W63_02414 [Bacillus velezensis]|nr:hypothetical protein C2W63_02414 [Bacillus velezensis]